MSTQIHSTAVIADGAELGVDVTIGPHTIIGPSVHIGDRTRVGPQVVIDGVTRIGEENVIVGQASLGAAPQDISYRGEPTLLEIGDGNMIREFVTINRGTVKGGARTSIGSGCLLMACSHVAHDCDLRDGVILANNVLLAGHVLVGKRANLSGAAAAHHFCTIGEYAYVGGLSRVVQDVPPFMIVEGHPSRVRGVNIVGLQRADVPEEDIEAVRTAFRRLYRSGVPKKRVFADMRAESSTPARVLRLIEALENTERGSKGRHRESLREEFAQIGRDLVAVRT